MILEAVAILIVVAAQDDSQSNMQGSSSVGTSGPSADPMNYGSNDIEMPDVDSGFDSVGPYDAEPSYDEAEHPKPINETWVNTYMSEANGN